MKGTETKHHMTNFKKIAFHDTLPHTWSPQKAEMQELPGHNRKCRIGSGKCFHQKYDIAFRMWECEQMTCTIILVSKRNDTHHQNSYKPYKLWSGRAPESVFFSQTVESARRCWEYTRIEWHSATLHAN